MRRHLLGGLVVSLILAGPWVYATWRQTVIRHYRVSESGRLHRSGAFHFSEAPRFLHEQQIRGVINLRHVDRPNDPYPDPEEEAHCQQNGIAYLRLRPLPWIPGADGTVPAQKNIDAILDFYASVQPAPVWIHCFSGEHRTGIVWAVLRMEYDRWTAEQAIAEMRRLGYRNIDRDPHVKDYLLAYRPRWQSNEASPTR